MKPIRKLSKNSKILIQLGADTNETKDATAHFEDKTVSYREVANYINIYRLGRKRTKL